MKFNKSMVDFVLDKKRLSETDAISVFNITNYANFLSQKLELYMFIACDENGNVLEEPKEYFEWYKWGDFTKYGKSITPKCKEYHESLSKVIFDGFEVKFNNCKDFKYQSETIILIIDKETYIEYNCYHKNFVIYFDEERDFKTISTIEDLILYNLDIKDTIAKELWLI